MISILEFEENSFNYNRRIEPSDWRYSAAIVGMIRFFKDRNIPYSVKGRYLYYNFEDVCNDGKDFEGENGSPIRCIIMWFIKNCVEISLQKRQ